jgi:hypothetical protein
VYILNISIIFKRKLLFISHETAAVKKPLFPKELIFYWFLAVFTIFIFSCRPIGSFNEFNGSGGVFWFHMEMPVYALTKEPSTNDGPDCQKWHIRTGLGAELHRLDDGKSGGGCVLIGVTDVDNWSAIDWNAYD